METVRQVQNVVTSLLMQRLRPAPRVLWQVME
jgi:hypothetical protein